MAQVKARKDEIAGASNASVTAYSDYEIDAANMFDGDPRRVTDRIPCYGLLIDPPLGARG